MTKSLIDQILALPLYSTVITEDEPGHTYNVLFRTGSNGWLLTGRMIELPRPASGRYEEEETVRTWVTKHQETGVRFFHVSSDGARELTEPTYRGDPELHRTMLVDGSGGSGGGDTSHWFYSAVGDTWWCLNPVHQPSLSSLDCSRRTSYPGFDRGAAEIIRDYGLADVSDGFKAEWEDGDLVQYRQSHGGVVIYNRERGHWYRTTFGGGAMTTLDRTDDAAMDSLVESANGYIALRRGGQRV